MFLHTVKKVSSSVLVNGVVIQSVANSPVWLLLRRYTTEMEQIISLISDFRCDVNEIYALLPYSAAACGHCIPTFRDNVSDPSSRVKKSRKICCPEMSVKDYHTTPRNIPEGRRSHIMQW
jgi:hypothetical protein